eukprot:gene50298-44843_t
MSRAARHNHPFFSDWCMKLCPTPQHPMRRSGNAFAAYGAGFLPWGLSPHHSVVGFKGDGEELRSGQAPRDTYAWREGQPGAQADFGRHQVAATTDHTVPPAGVPAFLAHYVSLTCF